MGFSPRIFAQPPATPYNYTQAPLVNVGIGVGYQHFHSGQYNLPFAPYSRRTNVYASLNPCAGAGTAAANVVPVALRGNGGQLAGPMVAQSLMELNAAPAGRGILG